MRHSATVDLLEKIAFVEVLITCSILDPELLDTWLGRPIPDKFFLRGQGKILIGDKLIDMDTEISNLQKMRQKKAGINEHLAILKQFNLDLRNALGRDTNSTHPAEEIYLRLFGTTLSWPEREHQLLFFFARSPYTKSFLNKNILSLAALACVWRAEPVEDKRKRLCPSIVPKPDNSVAIGSPDPSSAGATASALPVTPRRKNAMTEDELMCDTPRPGRETTDKLAAFAEASDTVAPAASMAELLVSAAQSATSSLMSTAGAHGGAGAAEPRPSIATAAAAISLRTSSGGEIAIHPRSNKAAAGNAATAASPAAPISGGIFSAFGSPAARPGDKSSAATAAANPLIAAVGPR